MSQSDYQSDYMEIVIPALPPGANRTYQPVARSGGKAGIILTPAARQWDEEAALMIGAAAGRFCFKPDPETEYEIFVRWWGGKHDADAHLKLVQDCLTRKVGFDDRQIKTAVIQRIPLFGEDEPKEGIHIYLFQADEQDWVSTLLFNKLRVKPLPQLDGY